MRSTTWDVKRNTWRFCSMLLGIMLATIAVGQSITVELSRDTVLAENTFTVTYTFEDMEVPQDLVVSPISRLELKSGPNVMSSVQIINGDKSSTTKYTYTYFASESGTYTVPPLRIGDIGSEALVFDVLPNPKGIVQVDSPGQIMQFGSPFQRMDIDIEDIFGRRRKPQQPHAPKKPAKPKRPLKRI